jgi:soluble lytic murein transglycosylase-like protein
MTSRCMGQLFRVASALAVGAASLASHAAEGVLPDRPAPECRMLGADTQRLAAKFTLGLGACPQGGAAAATSASRDARQAQQLYLYDTIPDPALRDRGRAAKTRGQPSSGAAISRTSARYGVYAKRALQLAPTVDAAARAHNIDPLLMHAIARVESHHNASAVSPAGALGVMQVMPATASRFGVAHARVLLDAPTNVAVSAAYLKTLQQRFGNDLVLVLAAYNAGEGAVERYGRRVPPYAETQTYVRDVLAEYSRLRRIGGSTRGPGTMESTS